MEITEELSNKVTAKLIGALPEEAENDYRAWLQNPTEDGMMELLKKYNIDAEKLTREVILEEENE